MGRYLGQLGTDALGVSVAEVKVGCIEWTAAEAAAEAAVHAAITSNGSTTVTTTTAITQPSCARNIVITPGGTTASVKAANIVINGTNIGGEAISESILMTENGTDAVVGSKAFKTVTSIVIPAQDGAGATFAFSSGSKLGLPVKLTKNPCLKAVFGTAADSALPTLAMSSTVLCSNTAIFATALDGTALQLYLAL
jgi:hypothetical protein